MLYCYDDLIHVRDYSFSWHNNNNINIEMETMPIRCVFKNAWVCATVKLRARITNARTSQSVSIIEMDWKCVVYTQDVD